MSQITLRQLLSNIPAKYEAVVEHAYNFALNAHKDQKRASGEPFISHPLAVAYFLSTLRLDGNAIAAALLHDILEDTSVQFKELEKEFGQEIAFLVDSVTRIGAIAYKEKPDITQKQNLKAQTLRKMIFAMAKDLRVILIKLADRYHNAQTLEYLDPQNSRKIALETLEIYAPIAERLGMGHLKGELEDPSFSFAYPEECEWLKKRVKEPRQSRAEYLEILIPKLKKILENREIEIKDIHFRAKRYYSLYKKMLTRDMDISQIYDLIAVRIIVPDIESCYSALGIIHTYYKPLPGLIKDYIALPRPNGYQSLHTTVFCEEGKIVEIQLRTPEIHEYAENGIAAHWAYTESGKKKGITASAHEIQWVSKLRNLVKETGSNELIKDLKLDFFKHRIFIFTPKGDVIDLPEGAIPLDAAYEIHTELGHLAAGARVNGKLVSLASELKNGDVVEIIKTKQAHPSRDWLNIVKTTEAKKKIRSWLARQSFSGEKFERAKLSRFTPLSRKTGAKELSRPLILASQRRGNIGSGTASPIAPQVIVGGQEKVQTHLAKCCAPEPYAQIIGYITKAQKVSIHAADCNHLCQRNKDRFIPAHFETFMPYQASLILKVKDRIGMLKDISEVLARNNINIKEIKNTPANGDTVEIRLTLSVQDASQLEKSKEELTKTKDVISIQRVA